MRTVVLLSSLLAVASIASSDQRVLVLARDGSIQKSEAERVALIFPTEENIAKLIESGYVRHEIDNWAVLLIDPLAPPLCNVRVERLLLKELPADGKPVAFGTLSKDAQNAIKRGSTFGFCQSTFNSDTLVAFEAEATFLLSDGKRKRQESRKVAGPTFGQMAQMWKSPANQMSKEELERLTPSANDAELSFDRSRISQSASAELYKRCTEEITKMLEFEVMARNVALIERLRDLAKNGPIPDSSWTKDSIPEDMKRGIQDSLENSWKVLGFDSKDQALSWFADASLTDSYVSFNVVYGDGGAVSNGPVVTKYGFGGSGR